MSDDTIVQLLHMKKSTVYNILQCFKTEGKINYIRPPGRPGKLSLQDKRFTILRPVKQNSKVSGAQF